MRNFLAGTVLIFAAASACGGGSKKSEPTPGAATPSVSTTASAKAATAATPAATSQPQGDVVEVTGIVGGVSLSGKVIEIKRLQGAAVTQVAVEAATPIRKAGGGTIQLKDIRPSDRIIAKGKLNDRRDALVASEITVQDVIPGAQPGG
jgi:hypothetical protein